MCRWLLLSHDRVGADEFPLTHEFLAQMLGTRRPTVTAAAVNLQKAGLITYHRGKITILDRKGLEAACCRCYQVRERVGPLAWLTWVACQRANWHAMCDTQMELRDAVLLVHWTRTIF